MVRRRVVKRVIFLLAFAPLLLMGILLVRSAEKRAPSIAPVLNPPDRPNAPSAHQDRIPAQLSSGHAPALPATAVHQDLLRGARDAEPGHEVIESVLTAISPVKPSTSTPADHGCAIRGRVLSAEGRIVDEADGWPQKLIVRVRAADYARDCELDGQGRFACTGLDIGSYLVSVTDAWRPAMLPCEPVEIEVGPRTAAEEIVFTLGKQRAVTVVVLDQETGLPVHDETVAVTSMSGLGKVSGRTDAQGYCVFRLPAGLYRIGTLNRENGQAGGIDSQFVAVGSDRPVCVVQLFVPTSSEKMLHGVLVDSYGYPVDGFVHFDLAVCEFDEGAEPADWFCVPKPDGFSESGLTGYACDASGRLARHFFWPPEIESMTIVLEPRAGIAGRLVGPSGSPLSDVRVGLQTPLERNRWRSEDESLYTLTVADDGRFRIDGVAVGRSMRVVGYRGRIQGHSELFELKPGRTRDIGLVVLDVPERESPLGRGVLFGRIIDENGNPVVRKANFSVKGRRLSWPADSNGRFRIFELPEDRPVTITAEIPGYGAWLWTAKAGDRECTFQVYPDGWELRGTEAPPLIVDRWFNHTAMSLKDLRGRVVLLVFRGLYQRDDLSDVRVLCREHSPKEFVAIVVFGHLRENGHSDQELAIRNAIRLFGGAPVAGCFDADADLVRDFMPEGQPPAVAGATHRLYGVNLQPALMLIDKAGKVRCCRERKFLRERIQSLLAE